MFKYLCLTCVNSPKSAQSPNMANLLEYPLLLRVPGAETHHKGRKNGNENGQSGLGLRMRDHVQVNCHALDKAGERDCHRQAA